MVKNIPNFIENLKMKKIGLLLLLALPLFTWSQNFNAGLIAGGIVSQVDGDTYGGYDKFGFLGGAYIFINVSPHSSFQMEMEYIQKGSRHNLDSNNNGQTYLLRLHYFEIPVLYQYTFGKRFMVETGPAFDVLMGYQEESDGMDIPPTEPFRTVTLSGIIGTSAYLTNHLRLNFRLNYSLISLRNTSAPYPPHYRKILFECGQYNNVLSLSLLWDFRAKDFR